MKKYGVRPSVRLSVPARIHSSRLAAAGLLLWVRRARDIDRPIAAAAACSGGRVRAVPRCQRSPLHYYYYFLTPVLNSRGMKKLRYAIQKSTKIQLE